MPDFFCGTSRWSKFAVGASVTVLAAGVVVQYARRPRWIEGIPKTMRQAFLTQGSRDIAGATIQVQHVAVPEPGPGQVLVKVAAAPVNPSDDGVWKMERIQTATPIGIECSGTVVATGGGLLANNIFGKNVAASPGSGAYAEYVTANVSQVFELPSEVSVESGCSFFINPFTALAMLEVIRESGGHGFVHTAGASQLGQMLVKLCKLEGVTIVSVVRRADQKDRLVQLGAEEKHVIITDDAGEWKKTFKRVLSETKIKFAFDAIAGKMTGDIFTLLPPGGALWVYGRLSDQDISGVQPLDLIYRGKKLHGFMVTSWIMNAGILKAFLRSRRFAQIVRKHLLTFFASDFVDASLEKMHENYVRLKAEGLTGAKLRVLL